MKYSLEQLENYVHAIDLYNSDEGKWLRDKSLEKSFTAGSLNPELLKFVLAIEDVKAELAIDSVELARRLVEVETQRRELKEALENLKDWCEVKASKARVYPHPNEKEFFLGKADAFEVVSNRLNSIMEESADN